MGNSKLIVRFSKLINEKNILIFCIISFLYFSLNKITYFDVYGDARLWHHLAKVQAFKTFILDAGFAPPLPYWINGFFLRIYDYTLLPRFVSLFSFIVAVIVTTKLLKKLNLQEEKIFLFLSVLLLNPYFIYYSRSIMTDIFFFIFFWFTLLNLYIFLNTKEKKHLYYSAVSFALLSLVKSFALVVFLPILGVLALLAIRRKITVHELIRFTMISSIGFLYLGIVNIYGYLTTGLLYEFSEYLFLIIITIMNFLGFTEIIHSSQFSSGLQNPQSARIIADRIIHFLSYITLYTLPFIGLLAIEKIHRKEKPVFSYNQKVILSILLLLFITVPVVKQFHLRHFLVIFPVIYLFAVEKFEINKLKYATIILIAISSIVNIYSFHMFRENPFLPDSDLHIRSDIRLRTFEYVNSHTSRHEDIVILQGRSGEQDAYETILHSQILHNPPTRSKYVVYSREEQVMAPEDMLSEERDAIETLLINEEVYTLEKVFSDEFNRKYYVYKINPEFWSNVWYDFYLVYIENMESLRPWGPKLEDKSNPTLFEVYEEAGIHTPHNAIVSINPLGMYLREDYLLS